jgi:hypothetical protein
MEVKTESRFSYQIIYLEVKSNNFLKEALLRVVIIDLLQIAFRDNINH